MNADKKNERSLVFSYLELRKAIGILGITFPFIIYFGARIIFATGLQSSISYYYHTEMRDVLVGSLFAWGFFLLSYKGYEKADDKAGDLAFVFSLGLALFPTLYNGVDTTVDRVNGYLHLVCAVGFFLTITYFCLVLFVKSDQTTLPKKKQQRNMVYRTCGGVIALCILGMVIDFLFPTATARLGDNLVFWLETSAILTFGVSWFTKGEAIALLNDTV